LARLILGGEIRDGVHLVADLDPSGNLKFESRKASREHEEAALKEA
jgi:hypothetical protein